MLATQPRQGNNGHISIKGYREPSIRGKLLCCLTIAMPTNPTCPHEILQVDPSPFAELAGFSRADVKARTAAALKSGRVLPPTIFKIPPYMLLEAEANHLSTAFPAPLVLPHDALNYDPDEPAQSMKSWCGEKARNRPGADGRRVLYVADVPQVGKHLYKSGIKEWMYTTVGERPALPSARLKDMMEYLAAYYHRIEVREFTTKLSWNTWKSTARTNPITNGVPKYVALEYGDAMQRIRTRPAPDGVFKAQMNLDDILDAAIDMLPKDAYALLLLVDHDIYENEDDDFCCGRAYGGSRVAVVQSARYNPQLDASNDIDLAHAWPTSHCKACIDSLCAVEEVLATAPTAEQVNLSKLVPMHAAMAASSTVPIPTERYDLGELWFSRVARTASHELGHCFGMAHCVYYACNMQSTGGMQEDMRQPPYLCPVCLAKLGHAVCVELSGSMKTTAKTEEKTAKWVEERYEAIAKFCEEEGREDVAMWRGLAAWIEGVLGKKEAWTKIARKKLVQVGGELQE
jgi:archaemetzincin